MIPLPPLMRTGRARSKFLRFALAASMLAACAGDDSGDANDDLSADSLQATGADTVAVTASSELTAARLRRLGWQLEGTGVDLVLAPALTDVAGPRIHTRPVAGARIADDGVEGAEIATGLRGHRDGVAIGQVHVGKGERAAVGQPLPGPPAGEPEGEQEARLERHQEMAGGHGNRTEQHGAALAE